MTRNQTVAAAIVIFGSAFGLSNHAKAQQWGPSPQSSHYHSQQAPAGLTDYNTEVVRPAAPAAAPRTVQPRQQTARQSAHVATHPRHVSALQTPQPIRLGQ